MISGHIYEFNPVQLNFFISLILKWGNANELRIPIDWVGENSPSYIEFALSTGSIHLNTILLEVSLDTCILSYFIHFPQNIYQWDKVSSRCAFISFFPSPIVPLPFQNVDGRELLNDWMSPDANSNDNSLSMSKWILHYSCSWRKSRIRVAKVCDLLILFSSYCCHRIAVYPGPSVLPFLQFQYIMGA